MSKWRKLSVLIVPSYLLMGDWTARAGSFWENRKTSLMGSNWREISALVPEQLDLI